MKYFKLILLFITNLCLANVKLMPGGYHLQYLFDGTFDASLNYLYKSTFADATWHHIKVIANEEDGGVTKDINIQGLILVNRPATKLFIGNPHIEMKNNTCDDKFVFKKVGDFCSFDMRATADSTQIKPSDTDIRFNFTLYSPNLDYIFGNMSASGDQGIIMPQEKLASYQLIDPSQSEYYQASEIAKEPSKYQIMRIVNGSLTQDLNITGVDSLDAKYGVLIHRTTNDDNDPYYGKFSECAATPNASLRQISNLPHLDDSCIVIVGPMYYDYKFKINTDGGLYSFPQDVIKNGFSLKADEPITIIYKFTEYKTTAMCPHGMRLDLSIPPQYGPDPDPINRCMSGLGRICCYEVKANIPAQYIFQQWRNYNTQIGIASSPQSIWKMDENSLCSILHAPDKSTYKPINQIACTTKNIE